MMKSIMMCRLASKRFPLPKQTQLAASSATTSFASTSPFNGEQRRGFATASKQNPKKTVLVLGSSGALGSSVSRYLSRQLGAHVIGADVVAERPADLTGDWELDAFLQLPAQANVTELSVELYSGVQQILNSNPAVHGLDAIVCANGGWHGDPPPVRPLSFDDDDDPEQALSMRAQHVQESAVILQHMINVNLHPVLAASLCAQHCCVPGALVVVMGATAALGPTPGMMGYGVSKAATHHIIQTMGALSTQGLSGKTNAASGIHKSVAAPTVVGILPTTLDTPGNRAAMPAADVSSWTRLPDIAQQVGVWLTQPSLRPHAGSLVKVHPDTTTGEAVFELVR